MNKLMVSLLLTMIASTILPAQKTTSDVTVDKNGVMRWKKSKAEVKGFGVNYTVPFAHAYRSAKRLGVDPKKAIDNDVYHFSRLEFDLYRIHVWDTEISDTLGNLIQNEHLDAFDYLIMKLKEKGMNYVLTPIAFWGNGWPEPDEQTPGFSHKYGKGNSLTNPDAIKAQQNYLYQFANHVNPYTKLAYKNDPSVIAFEVSNEPHHRGEAAKVQSFVKGMVDAIKRSGTKKPIFYNISHGVNYAEEYFKAGIDGGTFQWYPSGLGYQQELSGNYLPNANNYEIPFENTIKKYKGAKLVYEFDAADIGKSYIYPALARSFRKAGIQIATHFAYDPTYLGYANTEYNTHYMNLVYTPKKALALMISSKIFHEVPMYQDFGGYPANKSFDKFSVDYLKDLATYNSEESFIYTNHTGLEPLNTGRLKQIAGYGNSHVVKYDGAGAYFLDKIENGVWRLELMPDAIWVRDPFGRNSPRKTVGVVNWREHKMEINLPDLSSDFTIKPLNQGNTYTPSADNNSFQVMPGTYLISKNGITHNLSANSPFGKNKLGDFYAPESTLTKPWIRHTPPTEISSNSDLTLFFQFASPKIPKGMDLVVQSGFRPQRLPITQVGPYQFEATVPAELITVGGLNYNLEIALGDEKYMTYPAGQLGRVFEWDFYDRSAYSVRVVPPEFPIVLYETLRDASSLVRQWRRGFTEFPLESGQTELQMKFDKLFVIDNENPEAEPIHDYSFKHFIIDELTARKADLTSKKEIVITGRSLTDSSCKLQVALVLDDGTSFGGIIELAPEQGEYRIALNDLTQVRTVTLPRPYPTFLPYYFEHKNTSEFDIKRVESIQFSIGPGLEDSELLRAHGIGLLKVTLN